MSNNLTFLIIFIVLAIGIGVLIFCQLNSRKHKILTFVRHNCVKQVAVLLDREIVQKQFSLSGEEENKICELSLEDWKHWLEQIELVKEISNKYPSAFDEFIDELFPQIRNRKCVKIRARASAEWIRFVLIEAMTSNELSLVLAETNENWELRIRRSKKASNIKKDFHDGYEIYCEVMHNMSPSNIEVIRDKDIIIEYHKAFKRSKIYDGWIDKQAEFSDSKFYKCCKEFRNCDGRYKYNVKFSRFNKFGKMIDSEFLVWQGFFNSYALEPCEMLSENMITTKNNLPKFENRERFFVESVFNQLICLFDNLSDLLGSKPLFVFVNTSRYEWSKRTYDYHYKHLRNKLSESGYEFVNLETISEVDNTSLYECVILIDLRTHNEDLINNCRIVAEYFTDKQPFIAYYSYLKEFSVEEVEKLYESSTKKSIDLVKELFSKVNKHSYFSYVAITNTLIGEARNAEDVKKIWISNPEKFFFKAGDCTNKKIAGQYSTDGGNYFTEFDMKGNYFSLDDVSKYTYQLFCEMGVWTQFVENGERAISKINQLGDLSRY